VPSFTPIPLEAFNPGPMTGRGNQTYLLIGSTSQSVLIDAGVGDPRHLSSIDQELRTHGTQLGQVLVTHGHTDHVSGVPHLAARHPKAVFSKFPWPEEDRRYDVKWHAVAEGDEITLGPSHLAVLHTPGHSPDHVSFWHESTRTAFTGDLVVQGGSVMIHASRGGDLIAYLASLERLIMLRPAVLLPGHGPAITDPLAVLNGYIEHRLIRENQVVDALREGQRTVREIAESIYHGLDPELMAAAHENVKAHLEKLKREGRVVTEDERWAI
jgi:glyoxylase-like metal-dependent hydrolase (beta-lactamase superfamily II)